jgi:hypothetical protein
VVSATDPFGRMLALLDRRRYYFFQLAAKYIVREVNKHHGGRKDNTIILTNGH